MVGENVNSGNIINSYAVVDVKAVGSDETAAYYVGGLIGFNTGDVSNTYTAGDINGREDIGGLVGRHAAGEINNSYARAKVTGDDYIGGLVGSSDEGTITDSYWDTNVSGIEANGSIQGKTTTDLQQSTAANAIYREWSSEAWDFGTSEQYPALKYSGDECSGGAAPDYCGVLFAGQRSGLQSLQLSDNAILGGDFSNKKYQYSVTISNAEPVISLMPFAAYPTAEIKLRKSDGSETELSHGEHSPDISLAGISTMMIIVKDARSEVSYRFNLKRFDAVVKMTVNNKSVETVYEGDTVALEVSSDEANLTYQWTDKSSSDVDLLEAVVDTTVSQIEFEIPNNYVDGNLLSSTATIEVKAVLNKNSKELVLTKETNIRINKKNNGDIGDIGQPTINDLLLTAPQIDSSDDTDGKSRNPISYQWQSLAPGTTKWQDEKNATSKTYTIARTVVSGTQYRVKIIYTDGQNYLEEVLSQPITYVDIDKDNNGLIDIFEPSQLNAIRYQPDGTGYRESSASTVTTMGCPEEICRGYELKKHIDLEGYTNWQPIGDNESPFSAKFKGNHYTIVNLQINNPDTADVGLFGKITQGAEIRSVGLLKVDIYTDSNTMNNVGGLVGYNAGGMVINSYVIGRSIEGGNHVGALVGSMSAGTVAKNYATIDSLKQKGNTVCQVIGTNFGGTLTNNEIIGGCNSGLFECPVPSDSEEP